MTNDLPISDKWIKASIIGTIWAASEIVLGSFLHNLKVPFSGNILTGIGLTILISVNYIWKEKGLFWRAGIICALLKTLSPSAFIFGPMIAIFTESLLLESSVRIFGRTTFAYIIGSMIAMSWNLFQKAFNLIIFYGNNFIDLYTNLVRYAEKQLNIHFDIFWLPLLILLVLYLLFGAVAGVIGIRTGKRVSTKPVNSNESYLRDNSNSKSHSEPSRFVFSLAWLAADIGIITGLLILVGSSKWFYYVPAVTIAVAIWSFRYKRALKQISRLKFWVIFVIITMVSAFVFTAVQTGSRDFVKGFMIGIEMNFRAIIIIVGFSVLGTELYNPKIRNIFLKTYFKQLPLALELSAKSLPSMIASIPDVKTLLRDPVSLLSHLISQVDARLNEIKGGRGDSKKIFIITGGIEEGKTTLIQELISKLRDRNISCGGIYSPRIIEHGATTGYDVVDIQDGKPVPFLREIETDRTQTVGRFAIKNEGLLKGNDALSHEKVSNCSLVIIDEVGPLELKGGGWADNLGKLLGSGRNHILIVVRKSLTEKVIAEWALTDFQVFDISVMNFSQISGTIMNEIL